MINVQFKNLQIQMQALRLEDRQPMSSQLYEDEQLQLMTANLLKIKRQITQRNEKHAQNSPIPQHESLFMFSQNLKNKSMNATRTTQLSQEIRQKYQEYLMSVKLPNNHQQKLQHLLQEQQMSLGTTVALFEMLFYFRDVISEQILQEVTQKCFNKILKSGSKLSKAEKYCLLQLIALCGIYNQQIVSYVIQQMLEGRLQFQISFVVMSNMGYKGLEMLVSLAREDFKQTPIMILNHLASTQQVVKQLIIPILVEDLSNYKSKLHEKDIILSILNRLNQVVSTSRQIFPLLTQLMVSNPNDRGFIASALRSCGPEGQKVLLQLMNQNFHNQKIMLPIVSVLPWRAPADPVLRIRVIEYTLGSNFMPGTLYQYQGNIQPSAFSFEQEDCCDSLCLNARDFIAALNRMLNNKLEAFQNEQIIRKGSINNIKMFTLYEVIQKQQSEKPQISTQVVRALTKCLNSQRPQIREAAINSLGLIGLPEAYVSIDQLSKCLWDKDSRNRSMGCWAISKLCDNPNKKVISRLVQLLKDNFWKVRISACICLGVVVKQPQQAVIQALIRCLKDNSINKVTVCQTIIKMGLIGQQILLQILKNSSQNDFKLKEAVIYCLREADVKNPHIDFVLQQIFKHCKGTRVQTRVNCLQTLNFLRVKAAQQGENIVYLKAKTILPFYYYFLEDPSLKIREMATESIFSFGGQAELIFIEGIAKGSQLVRIQSAKGLARLGIQNFRALILGLRDQDASVRQTTTNAILNAFTAEDVSYYYSSKPQQVPSLLCNLKDILSGGGLSQQMKSFIKQSIILLQKISKEKSQQILNKQKIRPQNKPNY